VKKKKINLNPKHLSIVKNVLNNHLTNDTVIWLFGSRVTESFKPYSDLDIALQNKDNFPISLKILTTIEADFIESDLPWKVDVIDYSTISGIFKENIDSCKVELK
jgi:predicted nucleotidyltransferase